MARWNIWALTMELKGFQTEILFYIMQRLASVSFSHTPAEHFILELKA